MRSAPIVAALLLAGCAGNSNPQAASNTYKASLSVSPGCSGLGYLTAKVQNASNDLSLTDLTITDTNTGKRTSSPPASAASPDALGVDKDGSPVVAVGDTITVKPASGTDFETGNTLTFTYRPTGATLQTLRFPPCERRVTISFTQLACSPGSVRLSVVSVTPDYPAADLSASYNDKPAELTSNSGATVKPGDTLTVKVPGCSGRLSLIDTPTGHTISTLTLHQ